MNNSIDFNQLKEAFIETVYMTTISLFIAFFIGLFLGIIIFITKPESLYPNKFINKFLELFINVFRSIPFIILLIILVPFTNIIVGSILGPNAALPALIISSSPFYARMCLIALSEVSKGTIEATRAMGASNIQIIRKVLIAESKPALISSITVMGISLVGYTAMAGAIGAGGLGNLAYLYGAVRHNPYITFSATFSILVIVFFIQFTGDKITKKIDKR